LASAPTHEAIPTIRWRCVDLAFLALGLAAYENRIEDAKTQARRAPRGKGRGIMKRPT
jgi:hypothetical protein